MARLTPTKIRNAEAKWSPHWETLEPIPEAVMALNQFSRAHSCIKTISFRNHEYHNAINGQNSKHTLCQTSDTPCMSSIWKFNSAANSTHTDTWNAEENGRDRNSRPSMNALHSGKITAKLRNLECFAKFGAKLIRAHMTPNLSYTMDSSVWKSWPQRQC